VNGRLKNGFNYNGVDTKILKEEDVNTSAGPSDHMHAVVILYPAEWIDFEEVEQLKLWNQKLNGRSCIVLLTKIDKEDERIQKKKSSIFESDIVEALVSQFSVKTGIPASCIIPCISYRSDRDKLDNNSAVIDYLALKTMEQSLRQAETYIYNKFISPYLDTRQNSKTPKEDGEGSNNNNLAFSSSKPPTDNPTTETKSVIIRCYSKRNRGGVQVILPDSLEALKKIAPGLLSLTAAAKIRDPETFGGDRRPCNHQG